MKNWKNENIYNVLEFILRQKELPTQKEISVEFKFAPERARQIMVALDKKKYIKKLPKGKYELLIRSAKKLNKKPKK